MALTKVQIDGVEFSDSTDLNVDNGTLFVDSTNNRVGVGTTSPGVPLHIYHATTNGVARFESGDATSLIQFKDSGTTLTPPSVGAVSNRLVIQTNNTEALTVDSSQRVGIGTSSPDYKLHVSGANAEIGLTDTNVTDATWRLLAQTGNTTKLFRIYDSSNAADRFVINASGNVGIGTTSPGSTLDVAGVVTTSKGYTFSAASTAADTYTGTFAPGGNALAFTTLGTERARIDSSGRMGLGTTAPGSYDTAGDNLVVHSTGETGITIASGTSSGGNIYFADGTTGNELYRGWITYSHSVDAMRFGTSGTERARITSNGDFQFNSGYGNFATAYGVRAWVHFQGTSTVTIAGSGNVSSITDRGTGQYTVGFSTALVNNNYAVCGTATSTGNTDNSYIYNVIYYDYGTTGVKVATYNNSTRLDYTVISMAVVR